jgi:hypothetical protein
VQATVTRELLDEQLKDIRSVADTHGWQVDADLDAITVEVTMESPDDGEEYIVRLECHGYDAEPPLVEMVDPETGDVGTPYAYFDDGHSLTANSDGPIICHRFNRRVYEESGIHDDWNDLSGWQQEAGNLTNLGDILLYIHKCLQGPDYDGRYEER